MPGLSWTQIREWDYDGPGLEVRVEGRHVEIRQFDGWGEMRVQVADAREARALAAFLEAFASKEDGASALNEIKSRQFWERPENAALRRPQERGAS